MHFAYNNNSALTNKILVTEPPFPYHKRGRDCKETCLLESQKCDCFRLTFEYSVHRRKQRTTRADIHRIGKKSQ
ncbi:hypothetical protein P5673_001090 [Acropora cervicornis]|uniref:Uncharacterized protein n=1 Tax=Acropora cervicornis TaxID=6130 RepID=A0AAD9VG85_ACRCE|nr:hypothetical protein P5673_001090 [Acropora cervicornis]